MPGDDELGGRGLAANLMCATSSASSTVTQELSRYSTSRLTQRCMRQAECTHRNAITLADALSLCVTAETRQDRQQARPAKALRCQCSTMYQT